MAPQPVGIVQGSRVCDEFPGWFGGVPAQNQVHQQGRYQGRPVNVIVSGWDGLVCRSDSLQQAFAGWEDGYLSVIWVDPAAAGWEFGEQGALRLSAYVIPRLVFWLSLMDLQDDFDRAIAQWQIAPAALANAALAQIVEAAARIVKKRINFLERGHVLPSPAEGKAFALHSH